MKIWDADVDAFNFLREFGFRGEHVRDAASRLLVMKPPTFENPLCVAMILGIAVLALGSHAADSELSNALSVNVTFSETFAQQRHMFCTKFVFYGPHVMCELYEDFSGSFRIRGMIRADSSSVARFNEDTPVYMHVGNFEFVAKLGDDTNYVRGANGARFRFANDHRYTPRTYLTAKLDWTSDRIKFDLSGKSIVHLYDWKPIDAANSLLARTLLGQPSGSIETNVVAALQFGDAGTSFDIPVIARVRTGDRIFHDIATTLTNFTFVESTIRLKGSGQAAITNLTVADRLPVPR